MNLCPNTLKFIVSQLRKKGGIKYKIKGIMAKKIQFAENIFWKSYGLKPQVQ